MISADGLGDVVGALVGVNDLRIRHPLPRFPQTVCGRQRVTEPRLITSGTPLSDPQDFNPLDPITIKRFGTWKVALQGCEKFPGLLSLLTAGTDSLNGAVAKLGQ